VKNKNKKQRINNREKRERCEKKRKNEINEKREWARKRQITNKNQVGARFIAPLFVLRFIAPGIVFVFTSQRDEMLVENSNLNPSAPR